METVVTASRRAEALFQSPRSSSIVGRRELDERAARTTPEALEATPGVFVQQTNYGGGAPIIRGQVGNRILLLVDGIRLNNSTYRAGPNQFLNTVDPFAVDRIEVVRGLGSVANGSDAIGGTINVLTETPELGWGRKAVGQVQLRGATADRSGSASGRLAWSGETAGIVATGSARHFGTLRAGGGVKQPFTAYDEWSALLAGAWQPSPARRLSFSVQTTGQYDVPRSDRSFPTDLRVFSRQIRQLAYLRFERSEPGSRVRRLRTTVSWNRQGDRLDRLRLDGDLMTRDQATVDTFGAQLELDVDAGLPSENPLTIGFDLYWDVIAAEASEAALSGGGFAPAPSDVRYPSGVDYATAGVFVVHDLLAGPSYSLTAEARAGTVRVHLPEDGRIVGLVPTAMPLPALTETVPTYAFGLHGRHAIGCHLALYTGGTLGFRAPNVDDYARLGAEGPAFVIPTRGLRPERALAGELGLKGDWARARTSLAYAYTRISDALLRSPAVVPGLSMIEDLPIGRVRNVESASYHSIEVAAVAPLWRRLSLSTTASYTRGSLTAPVLNTDPNAPVVLVEQPANKVPPLFGRVALGWRENGRWFIEAVLRFSLAQTRLGETDLGDARICPPVPGRCEGTPAWATIGLRAGARLGRSVRVVGVADNLTDSRYRSHASGVDAPGRSLTLMLEGYL